MLSIREFYGENFANLKLKDDFQSTGGISHSEETLGEFMQEIEFTGDDYVTDLWVVMKECGVEI